MRGQATAAATAAAAAATAAAAAATAAVSSESKAESSVSDKVEGGMDIVESRERLEEAVVDEGKVEDNSMTVDPPVGDIEKVEKVEEVEKGENEGEEAHGIHVSSPGQQQDDQDGSQISMDESEAKEWRRYFISACRWFDLEQERYLRADHLQLILQSADREVRYVCVCVCVCVCVSMSVCLCVCVYVSVCSDKGKKIFVC